MDNMYLFEREAQARGFGAVCGIDEAGCGPLAGPVCAAAVILDWDNPIDGLDDSKKLSEKRREALFDEILSKATAYSVALIGQEEIDRINILQARLLAMRTAVAGLSIAADFALIDGDRDPDLNIDSLLVVKGDQKSASIAAASIMAKVTRDRFMLKAAGEYPMYMFEKHKGYPTKLHYDRLREYGPCPLHRKSFLKKFNQELVPK